VPEAGPARLRLPGTSWEPEARPLICHAPPPWPCAQRAPTAVLLEVALAFSESWRGAGNPAVGHLDLSRRSRRWLTGPWLLGRLRQPEGCPILTARPPASAASSSGPAPMARSRRQNGRLQNRTSAARSADPDFPPAPGLIKPGRFHLRGRLPRRDPALKSGCGHPVTKKAPIGRRVQGSRRVS
jgi:hypothetical protein